MATAFEVLAKDHEEVKLMLAELERGPASSAGAGSDQLALRKKMVQQLVIEESKHEAVEEMYFWPAVRDALTDGNDLADQAQAQEQEAKAVLDRLDKLDPEDGEFEALLGQFTAAGREHIAFEETAVWPHLREALSAEQAEELGHKLQEAKSTAPTRPHPHTPPSPGVLKTAGPVVAAADRLRDAATGRDE
jgi:multidrug efflux pump subunit AcrA (membrane-fusion protein)